MTSVLLILIFIIMINCVSRDLKKIQKDVKSSTETFLNPRINPEKYLKEHSFPSPNYTSVKPVNTKNNLTEDEKFVKSVEMMYSKNIADVLKYNKGIREKSNYGNIIKELDIYE